MPSFGPEVQTEIYGNPGLPAAERLPFAVEEWERRAREVLRPEAFGYVAGGSGGEDTMRANL